jgi:hypothetical protein
MLFLPPSSGPNQPDQPALSLWQFCSRVFRAKLGGLVRNHCGTAAFEEEHDLSYITYVLHTVLLSQFTNNSPISLKMGMRDPGFGASTGHLFTVP